MPVSLFARVAPAQSTETHARVQVFAGPEGGTRALCGVLTMRPDEANALIRTLSFYPGVREVVRDLVEAIRSGATVDEGTVRSILADRLNLDPMHIEGSPPVDDQG